MTAIDNRVLISRRNVLKAGVAGATLCLPLPYAWVWAQSDGAMKLLRLPKVALVLGNSQYARSPSLVNPANDAKAISEVLRQSGFDVTSKLDATLDDMAAAIKTYVQMLSAKKAVGLFYFAGHGVQLSWRNYLVPVDAAVRRLEDIQKSCVDLTLLIEGINKASNPMNVVILDACRDNPFGADARLEARGLSQMDAPHSTLLAYATAPGNVASDGEGANGLYTENLLREMRVPDAKIEDVFKRVRLNVRRRTNGQQIPWESTSLEEDFYFVPPKELKRLSEAEATRDFETELAIWEKIKASKESEPLEDYLRRYPGGKFSELAQFQLDRVLAAQGEKKIEIAPQGNNPYTKGGTVANANYRIGDAYGYRVLDVFTRLPVETYTHTVTDITDSEITYDSGLITNLLGSRIRGRGGRRWTDSQHIPLEYSVGKKWSTRYNVILKNGRTGHIEMDLRIVAKEQITVPAGTFDAFRIEGRGWTYGLKGRNETLEHNYWRAPTIVRRPIVFEEIRRIGSKIVMSERHELVAFKQS